MAPDSTNSNQSDPNQWGDAGQDCYPNQTCNEPNICEEGVCVAPDSMEPNQWGDKDQDCYPNQTCDDPYTCEGGVCVEPDSIESEEQGGLNEPCYDNQSCDGDLVCSESICVEPEEPVETGGLGQPCTGEDTCDDPYHCIDDLCEEPFCEPGEVVACDCPGDQDGESQCEDSAMEFSSCDCPPEVNCNDHIGLEIAVDNDNPSSGYSESQSENWLSRPVGACTSTYRYLSHTVGDGSRTGKAFWHPEITVSGMYRVSTGFRATENRTPSAQYIMHPDQGDTFSKSVNQRQGTDCTFADMGLHYCEAGGNCHLELDGTTDGHSDAADLTTFTLESCP